ncbi:hypothetical protein WN51_09319 [Melipona quadrifasciata]|uniref:Uncharacterized protein n=1 Tax=Melipona quadrifasciata TaxID=166423 RepID=A0A0N0BIF2_9HYME|nr:hypothetical protein WN51_09319 [Melipona quadrifasciata]
MPEAIKLKRLKKASNSFYKQRHFSRKMEIKQADFFLFPFRIVEMPDHRTHTDSEREGKGGAIESLEICDTESDFSEGNTENRASLGATLMQRKLAIGSRYCSVSIVGHREAVAFVEEKNTVWISRGGLRAGLLSLMTPRLVNAFPTLPLLLITVRELSNGSLLTETISSTVNLQTRPRDLVPDFSSAKRMTSPRRRSMSKTIRYSDEQN